MNASDDRTQVVGHGVDTSNPKYRCCCGCLTLIQGAVAVAAADLLGVVLHMIRINIYATRYGSMPYFWVTVFSLVLVFVFTSVLAYGVCMKEAKPFAIYLCYSIGKTAFHVFNLLLLFGAIGGDRRLAKYFMSSTMMSDESDEMNVYYYLLVVHLLAIGFKIWFAYIIYCCYEYMSDKHTADFLARNRAGTVASTAYMYQMAPTDDGVENNGPQMS